MGSSNMSGSNMVPLGAEQRRVGGGGSSSSSSGSSLLKPSYLSQPPPSSMPNMPPRNYDMPNMPNRDFPNMPNMQNAMVAFGQVDRAERKRTADKRESQDPGQGRHSPRSAEIDLRRQTAGRRTHTVGLQHPERVYTPSCAASPRRYADLREDPDRQDHHTRGGALGLHRERQSQDPGQGRHSPRSAEVDLRRQTAGRRTHTIRLQHPERVHTPSCAASPRRYADLREDPDRQDHHTRGGALRLHRERQSQDPGQGR